MSQIGPGAQQNICMVRLFCLLSFKRKFSMNVKKVQPVVGELKEDSSQLNVKGAATFTNHIVACRSFRIVRKFELEMTKKYIRTFLNVNQTKCMKILFIDTNYENSSEKKQDPVVLRCKAVNYRSIGLVQYNLSVYQSSPVHSYRSIALTSCHKLPQVDTS